VLHTDIPTQRDLDALLTARAEGAVSIYVPTTPISTDVGASSIEFRNLCDAAIDQLAAVDLAKRDVSAIADALAAIASDDAFWSLQSVSLAVFATPASVRTFRLPNRTGALVEVSDRFHVKPLFRARTFPQAAFVLALAQGSVRLLEISPEARPEVVVVPGMPSDVASAVGKSSIADRGAVGRIQGSEGQKVRMTQYARLVDGSIRPVIAGSDLPLILAATEPLAGIFRSVCTYPLLAEAAIEGSPESVADADLDARARTILDGIYEADLAAVRETFARRSNEGRASADLTDVARSATFGAVDTVLVDMDASVPGRIDEATGVITEGGPDDPAQYGIVDEIARRVYLARGRVLAVRSADIPGGGPVAAVLRYPI
jgi:hypothetical protein